MLKPPISTLLVDDNTRALELLRRYFESHGMDVACAGFAKAALELAGKHRFEAYIVDLLLPDASGFSLIETIRASDPDAAIVAFSGAYTSAQDAALTMRAGADLHVAKPCDGATLRHHIESMVTERRLSPKLLGKGAVRVRMDELTLIIVEGKPVDLSESEHRLIRVLARARGRVLSKEDCRRKAKIASEHAVVTLVSAIRTKRLGAQRDVLATVAGGFCLRLDYGPAHPDADRTSSNPPHHVRKPSPPPFRYSTPEPFPVVEAEEEEES